MRQKNIKICHNLLYQIFRNAWKIKDKKINKFEKNDIFLKKNKKNHNMIIEARSVFSVSINSKIKKLDL